MSKNLFDVKEFIKREKMRCIMKYCFVIGTLNYSGAEKVLSILINELIKRQNEVSIVLLEREYGNDEIVDGVLQCGAKATGKRISRLMIRWKYLRKNINSINPDVVISFGFVSNINTLVALINSGYPVIICERNDPTYDPRKIIEKIERNLLYRLASGYVFQTEVIKEYFATIINKKNVAIIANPIVDSGKRWSAERVKNVFSTVARLDDYQKDQIVLMKAFSIFHEKYPEYGLNIYGDGPDLDKYQKFINENEMDSYIKLCGKSFSVIDDIITSKGFILTSRFEGMPNALMEAMSIGMPCISTDCGGGGAKVLFDSCGGAGILVPVGNVDSISNAIIKLANDDRLQLELSKKSTMINNLYSETIIVEQWISFLNSFTIHNKG